MPQAPSVQEQVDKLRKKMPLPTNNGAWDQLKAAPEFFDTVCEWIAGGFSVRDFAKQCEINYGTLQVWLGKLTGDMQKRYEDARIARASFYADKILEVLDDMRNGQIPVPMAKKLCDEYRWYAERMDPALWGQRLQVEANVRTTHEMHLEAVGMLARMINQGDFESTVIEGRVEPELAPKQILSPDPQMSEANQKKREQILS